MSAKTDAHEVDVATWINTTTGIEAERPRTSVSFSDITLNKPGYDMCWLEVKTNHKDNLVNPRVFYDSKWQTTYTSYSAQITVELLNSLEETAEFINAISIYADIPIDKLRIPTTKAQFRGDPNKVPVEVLEEYFSLVGVNQYIANSINYDIGALVTEDYNRRNIHYVQAGDDFYRVGNTNPLDLPLDIPMIQGIGDYKVRIATRTKFSEVMAELKISDFGHSPYSCKPHTKKLNPFIV